MGREGFAEKPRVKPSLSNPKRGASFLDLPKVSRILSKFKILALLAALDLGGASLPACDQMPSDDAATGEAKEGEKKLPKFGTISPMVDEKGIKFFVDLSVQTFIVINLIGPNGENLQEEEFFVGPGSTQIAMNFNIVPTAGSKVEVKDNEGKGYSYPVAPKGQLPIMPTGS